MMGYTIRFDTAVCRNLSHIVRITPCPNVDQASAFADGRAVALTSVRPFTALGERGVGVRLPMRERLPGERGVRADASSALMTGESHAEEGAAPVLTGGVVGGSTRSHVASSGPGE